MSILTEIFAHKRRELAATKLRVPEPELERRACATPPPPDFAAALRDPTRPAPRLIAEVKQRSPSRGVLRSDFDPVALARAYAEHGAAAISVLTDSRYFGGALDHLEAIAALALPQPLLRKDFIFDRYQLLQARLAGASAALLIVAMLGRAHLAGLVRNCAELGLTALVEVHSRPELEHALAAGAQVIGITNRDLHTFETSLRTTEQLRRHAPDDVALVAESGIHTGADVRWLAGLQVDAALVGEALVTAPDVPTKVRALAQLELTRV